MKIALALLTLVFSLSARAQQPSVSADERLTGRLIAMLSSLDSSFSSGTQDGSKTYAAQMECSNPKGDQNTQAMDCFIRTFTGFSVSVQAPVQVTGVLAADLKQVMILNGYRYHITNQFIGLGCKITCADNSAVGDGITPVRNTCEISKVF